MKNFDPESGNTHKCPICGSSHSESDGSCSKCDDALADLLDVKCAECVCGTFREMCNKVEAWGQTRGILYSSTPEKQMLKAMEELGETARAILKNDKDGQIDGLGDTVVTLILTARLLGVSLADCLDSAYGVIMNRTGKMSNGVFVKDGN